MLKNAAIVSGVTLISRILGYFRDVIIAAALGTGPLNDAFIAAFKFANLFRNVFGEGALTSAFVPLFTTIYHKEGAEKALSMASKIQALLFITLVLFIGIILISMPTVIEITTPGFLNNNEQFITAVEIGRITFPYLLFISFAAFYGGILHSVGKFMPFAATAVIFNISMILFALYYNSKTKAHSIAYGVLAAGVVEYIWMVFFLKIHNVIAPITLPKFTSDVRTVCSRMGKGLISSGITQINTWVDMVIVSFVAGGLSYIYYADRILQLPLALIATSASTVLLPSLTKHLSQNDRSSLHSTKESAIRISSFILIPTALLLTCFAKEIVQLLLERGDFDSTSTAKTAAALSILALGLPAFAFIKLFTNTFHARGDIDTTVKIAGCSLVINIIISISLLKHFEHVAISIASATAAWITAILLIYIAHIKQYYVFSKKLIKELAAYIIFSPPSIIIIYILISYNFHLLISCCIGGISYILFNIVLLKYSTICKKLFA